MVSLKYTKENPESNLDLGLRALLEIDNHFERPLVDVLGEISRNTIHLLTDGYMCKYIYLQLYYITITKICKLKW